MENIVTYTKHQGAKAIIELQRFVGIEESYSDAEKIWLEFNHDQRHQTEVMHKLFVSVNN